MRLKLIGCLAILGLLCGCGHSRKPAALEVGGILGSPEEVVAKALMSRAEVTGLAGEKATLEAGDNMRSSGASSSGVPILRDIFPSLAGRELESRGQGYLVKGDKGTAILYVELKREDRAPWQLERWEVVSEAAYKAQWAKIKAQMGPLPDQEGHKKAIMERVNESFPADATRQVYWQEIMPVSPLLGKPIHLAEGDKSAKLEMFPDGYRNAVPVVVRTSREPEYFSGFVGLTYSKKVGWTADKAKHWQKLPAEPDLENLHRIE